MSLLHLHDACTRDPLSAAGVAEVQKGYRLIQNSPTLTVFYILGIANFILKISSTITTGSM